jgi:hypothetical protein
MYAFLACSARNESVKGRTGLVCPCIRPHVLSCSLFNRYRYRINAKNSYGQFPFGSYRLTLIPNLREAQPEFRISSRKEIIQKMYSLNYTKHKFTLGSNTFNFNISLHHLLNDTFTDIDAMESVNSTSNVFQNIMEKLKYKYKNRRQRLNLRQRHSYLLRRP